MNIRPDDSSTTRWWVSSESDNGVEYLVELCEYPIGTNQFGDLIYNGACGLTKDRIHGCRNFIFDKEPKLKRPEHMGEVHRCKHIRFLREYLCESAVDRLVLVLKDSDPNLHEDLQT